MSAEVQPSSGIAAAGDVEPKAALNTVPIWLIGLLAGLLYWGMVYFDQHSGWASAEVYVPYRSLTEVQEYNKFLGGGNPLYDRGKVVYENVCALCHNPDGMGKPNQAPQFVGSDWVLGNPNRMIRIPLSGLSGALKVKDQTWNLAMPAMGAALSDEDLAATLTYIRQSWGNKASSITPEQVKAVRAEVGTRTQPWTADELDKVQ